MGIASKHIRHCPRGLRTRAGAVLTAPAAALAALLLACSGPAAAAEPDAAQMDAGRKLFTAGATPACAICHALQDAGASGAVGPDLDELKPDASRVEAAVRNGIGVMPAFEALSDEEVQTLSRYVAAATGAQ